MKHLDSITFGGSTWENVDVERAWYHDRSTAIRLVLVEGEFGVPEPLSTATVNLTFAYGARPTSSEHVWIKDYAENEGLAQALVDEGIIEPTERTYQALYVEFREYKIVEGAL